jgi:hypothetical protein
MANLSNSPDNQDLDLGQLSKKVKNYLSRANDSFFDGILFLKRNIIIIAILFIVGAGLGIYKDTVGRNYEQKVFVIPNFGSTDFLYEQAAFISYRLRTQDTAFIKAAGIKNPEKFVKLKIEPVIEIYEFIEDKDVDEDDRKFQLFQLIAENGDMDKMLKDKTTSKYYKKHLITITTNGKATKDEIIEPLLKYVNSNEYFLKMKDEYIKNLELKTAANDTILKQIDAILNDFSGKKGNTGLVYYNDNTDLSGVIKLKNKIIAEQAQNRIDKVNFSGIVKDSGIVLNVASKSLTGGRMMFILPILFILIFVIFVKFRNYYKKQIQKRKVIITGQ